MARHQYQQPTLMDVLNGQAVESLALLQINRIIVESEAIDEHLHIIEKALLDTQNDWNYIYANTLEYDKLQTATELTYYYEINTKGKTRLSRDPWAQLRSNFAEFLQDTEIDDSEAKATLEYIAYPTYFKKKLIKAETILRWFIMPSDPEKAASILYTCLDNYDFMAEPDFDWKKQPQEVDPFNTWSNLYRFMFYNTHIEQLIADKCVESNYRTHNLYLRTLTMRRGSRLLLAIKQYYNEHGVWPPDLDSIKSAAPSEAFIDPVTENPLKYENHGERFSLYGETANIWPK
jgi:hypothetical protein